MDRLPESWLGGAQGGEKCSDHGHAAGTIKDRVFWPPDSVLELKLIIITFTWRTKNQYLGLCPAPKKGCPLSRAEVGSSVQTKQDWEQTAIDQFQGRQGERTGPRLLPDARDVPPAHPELPLDKET